MLDLVRDNLCFLFDLLIVGKSTFLKIMDKFPGVKVFPEPVENWQKVGIVCHNEAIHNGYCAGWKSEPAE
jgi:hypothetical protein